MERKAVSGDRRGGSRGARLGKTLLPAGPESQAPTDTVLVSSARCLWLVTGTLPNFQRRAETGRPGEKVQRHEHRAWY